MSHKREELKKGFTTFVKAEKLGKCPCCDENVYSDHLYVEEDKNIYHYGCYNKKKASEKSE